MGQKHYAQAGTFHITTNTFGKIPWCTTEGVPQVIIDNLVMTRNLHDAKLYAFCILPDHVHLILSPGKKGLSVFMHSFKRNISKDVTKVLNLKRSAGSLTRASCSHRGAGVDEPRLREESNAQKRFRWQNGFFDERIQTSDQRATALAYVQGNAMKHGLVTDILDWPWTSLHFEHLLDAMEIWLD